MTDDPKPECQHWCVVTYNTEDGNPAGLWGCADCRAKFVPLGPEMDDAKRTLDAAVAQAMAAERERCARVCEQMAEERDASSEGYELGCARRIRALTPEAK
jgi:hypothetical protein